MERDVELAEIGLRNRDPHTIAWLTVGLLVGLGIPGLGSSTGSSPRLGEPRVDHLGAVILSLDLARGSDLAAAAFAHGKVRVWHVRSGTLVLELSFPDPPTDPSQKWEGEVEPIRVRFSPDGKLLAVSFLSRIYLYDLDRGEARGSLGIETEDSMRPRPEPELARRPQAEGDAKQNSDAHEIPHWYQRRFEGDGRTRITDFAFTSDSKRVIAAYCRASCFDRPGFAKNLYPTGSDPVRLWAVASQSLQKEFKSEPGKLVGRIEVSPDGSVFAAVHTSRAMCETQLHELETGKVLYSLPALYQPRNEALIFSFAPDGTQFVTTGGRIRKGVQPWQQLGVYQTADGKLVRELRHSAGWRSIDLSPDGHRMAVAKWRGVQFEIWNFETGRKALGASPKKWGWSAAPPDRVRFDPDGDLLVVFNSREGLVAVYEWSR